MQHILQFNNALMSVLPVLKTDKALVTFLELRMSIGDGICLPTDIPSVPLPPTP